MGEVEPCDTKLDPFTFYICLRTAKASRTQQAYPTATSKTTTGGDPVMSD